MGEGVLGKDIKMGEEVFDDLPFLNKVKEICVNNHIRKIRGEELREFLEKVKAILVNNPNEFATIKDIANDNAIKEILENKWNLSSDPDYAVRWFLCHPISYLSPDILCLECRDHAEYAQWALKYNPDREKEELYPNDREWNHIIQELRQLRQKLYDLKIKAMVDFFPDLELEEELKRREEQLKKFEEEATKQEKRNKEEISVGKGIIE
jgi:hypothetical protein